MTPFKLVSSAEFERLSFRCVFATAQDAFVREYRIWVPADCVAATSPAYEKSALQLMMRTLKARTGHSRRARSLMWK